MMKTLWPASHTPCDSHGLRNSPAQGIVVHPETDGDILSRSCRLHRRHLAGPSSSCPYHTTVSSNQVATSIAMKQCM